MNKDTLKMKVEKLELANKILKISIKLAEDRADVKKSNEYKQALADFVDKLDALLGIKKEKK